jgi:fructose-1,6-bisphosphatase/inositol monophosphatase family enzyme
MMQDIRELLGPIRKLHRQIRDRVVSECEQHSLDSIAAISREVEGDTIYAVDQVTEELLIDFFEREIAVPILLIAEGLPEGKIMLPRGLPEDQAKWRIIVDPIDGTREIMYQKRSAWILTGVAPNRGPETGLHDIQLCVQTEIPTIKQHLCDELWAVSGEGAHAERYNRLTGEYSDLILSPSKSKTIAHGFAMVARFFPGAREELAAIDEEIIMDVLGPVKPGKAHCFEDQYLSTGGQLYELIAGHDRFVADLRPLMENVLAKRGLTLGICCHPYDMCTELIARELGVIVTDLSGGQLRAPLNVEHDVGWIGYANSDIRAVMEPALQRVLRKRGILS